MPWGKMDDKFHRNPKVRKLRRAKGGMAALGVWSFWWSWCLDDPELSGLVPSDEIETAEDKRAAALLVDVGLWDVVEGGYVFHDFHQYNPTKDQRESKKAYDRDFSAKQRAAAQEQERDSSTSSEKVVNDSSTIRDRVGGESCPARVSPPDPVPVPSRPGPLPVRVGDSRQASPAARATWEAYAAAYTARYTEPPLRNAKVNALVKQFVARIPHAEAPLVAAYYLLSQNARYLASGHAWGPLLQDAEKLRTEWATGRSGTAHAAREADKRSGRDAEFEALFERLEAEDRLTAGGTT